MISSFGELVRGFLPKQTLDETTIKNYLKLLIEIKPAPNIRIPETVIYGYGFDVPTFIYTLASGEFKFVENITIKQMFEFFDMCDREKPENAPKDFDKPLALIKTDSTL